MTKIDFRDWLIAQGCEFEPLKESTTGNSIKIVSPKGRHAYLTLPIDNSHAKHYMVCTICVKLMIPMPDECKHMEDLENEIRERHYPNHNR